MTSVITRRLAELERAVPATPRRSGPLSDEKWALLTALDAAVVTLAFGGTDGDPLTRLYRGIETAFASSDRVSPVRGCFGERLELAANMALQGNENHARPPEAVKRSIEMVRAVDAWDLVESYRGLRALHPTIGMGSDRGRLITRIDRDGVERYCWPEKAGDDAPALGWCGQGFEGAAVYWGVSGAETLQ